MKKVSLYVMLLIVISISGAFASGAQEKTVSEKFVIRLAHVLPTNEPVHLQYEIMADNISSRTAGAVEVLIFPNAQLGTDVDTLEMVRRGVNVIAGSNPSYISDFVPDIGILNGPYLFDSAQDLIKLSKTDWYREISESCSSKGIKLLAMNYFFGQRHLISDQAVKSPDDLIGMKVRVIPTKMWLETFAALGANPTPTQWSEVYSALSQGVVDAAEAPLSTLYGSRLHETKNVISMTGHFNSPIGIVMSQEYFDSLPAEYQQVIEEEAAAVGQRLAELSSTIEKEWRQKLADEGVSFVEVDKGPFKDAVASVYGQFPEWTPGLRERILEELSQVE